MKYICSICGKVYSVKELLADSMSCTYHCPKCYRPENRVYNMEELMNKIEYFQNLLKKLVNESLDS